MHRSTGTRSRFASVAAACATVLLGGCGWLGAGGGGDRAAAAPPGLDSLRAETRDDRNARLQSLAAEAGMSEADRRYVIGPDDLLHVEVFGVEELSAETRVSAEGSVSLPLLGPVPAEGRTAAELADEVEERLRSTYMKDPRVTVEVLEMGSHAVSVVGAVNRPGVYQISGARSVLQVLALAEGLSADAGHSVLVVRDDPDAGGMEEVDLRGLLESGELAHNVIVRPGDVVQVRSAGVVYVVGDVRQPGGFPLDRGEPLSVLQALALAEGVRPTAAAGDAVIIRPGGDGREEIAVDLEEVFAGSQPDPSLHEEDILFVPNSTTRSVARGVLEAFVRMATLRGLLY